VDVETSVRRMRWVALVALPVLTVAFQPPAEVVLPVGKLPFALAVAAGILVVQAASTTALRRRDAALLARFGAISVVATLALVAAVLFVFGVDPTSRFWPLLVVPVLEGAHRGGTRGAWATWAAGSALYAAEQAAHLATKPAPGSWVSAILWGVAILAIVAGGAGTLAARSERARRRELAENARLHELAATSRTLTGAVPVADVAATTLAAARDLTGAPGGAFLTRSPEGEWTPVADRGVDPADLPSGPSAHLDALARAAATELALTPQPGMAETGLAEQLGVERVAVVPVASGDRLVAAVALVADPPCELDDDRRQLLQLLAAQAGAAVHAAGLLAEQVEQNVRLRELSELRDDFTSILTHELRAPMTAINGYASVLRSRSSELDEDQRAEFLEQIAIASRRVMRLTSDVLQVARAERSGLSIDLEEVDLEPLARGVAEAEVEASDAHVLAVQISPPVPTVVADPERVRQVVQNLVANAVKYSPDGGRVTLGLAAEGDQVVLSIADDGVGIPAEHLGTIFEKFARASADRRIEGAGLGLYLTRMLVEAMGGTIRVSSIPEVGSTFTVRLPAASSSGADDGPRTDEVTS
jgi:signal transduction histidine kinase